ncbi:hypothetical protein JAAARDRAFT_88502, partial [Jaapia argillacea MUCL 33604]
PVATTLPEKYQIVQRAHPDPLAGMPELPTHPPDFMPGVRYTQERYEAMPLRDDGFLWPEEVKLVHWLIKAQELAFAWMPEERGRFDEKYFDPIVIPTIEHIPWVEKNIPILPGIYQRV